MASGAPRGPAARRAPGLRAAPRLGVAQGPGDATESSSTPGTQSTAPRTPLRLCFIQATCCRARASARPLRASVASPGRRPKVPARWAGGRWQRPWEKLWRTPPHPGRSGLFGTLNVPGSPRSPLPPSVSWEKWRLLSPGSGAQVKGVPADGLKIFRAPWRELSGRWSSPRGYKLGNVSKGRLSLVPSLRRLWLWEPGAGQVNWSGPVPLSLPHARPTWAGGYTCCSLARAPVSAGGKRGFCCCCPLRWPPVLPLQFYIARGRPTRPRAARRNVAPLLEPYLDVGH